MLNLEYDLKFQDLYDPAGLQKLDALWLNYLQDATPDLHKRVHVERMMASSPPKELSELITALAPIAQEFIAGLFGIRSEVNNLQGNRVVIGALAAVMIDNPLLPTTTAEFETNTLEDVLSLPWGFEIYSLLTRWNPLNFISPVAKACNGYKILVAGLGPAGFTVAHYLLNEGYTVVGVDCLKIEPQSGDISGIELDGTRVPFKPIKDVHAELFSGLDERVHTGFGWTAEYSMPGHWNKDYLNVIRTILERRNAFRMYGGVSFGGAITYNIAKELGFDHIVLAGGAGKPNLLDIPNALAKGCRIASDFLMSLQLSGAFQRESLTALKIRLPIIVIGGGLVAMDTATEALSYYCVQVERFLRHYECLGEKVFQGLSEEEIEIANEYLEHACMLRACRPEERIELLKGWGGVTVAYHKAMQQSPAYRLNPEEVEFARCEGVEFQENIIPREVVIGRFRSVEGLKHDGGVMPAKTILVAACVQPSTGLAFEDSIHFVLNGRYFRAIDQHGQRLEPEAVAKPTSVDIILNRGEKGPSASFVGDLHTSFSGNVVKAMASAKQSYPVIDHVVRQKPPSTKKREFFFNQLDGLFLVKVISVNVLGPKMVEVVVRAPLAVKQFQLGQFYRFQSYHAYAKYDGISEDVLTLAVDGVALAGVWVDKENGTIGLLALETGGASDWWRYIATGEPCIFCLAHRSTYRNPSWDYGNGSWSWA